MTTKSKYSAFISCTIGSQGSNKIDFVMNQNCINGENYYFIKKNKNSMAHDGCFYPLFFTFRETNTKKIKQEPADTRKDGKKNRTAKTRSD